MAALRKYALDAITLDPQNAIKHAERDIQAIAASLEKFGQQTPIVLTPEHLVIKGNGTVLAAQLLGWTTIIGKVTTLTGQALRDYAIADNQTARLSQWDMQALEDQVREFDQDLQHAIGFTDQQIAELLNHQLDVQPAKVSIPVPDAFDSYSVRLEGIDITHSELLASKVNEALKSAGYSYVATVV